MSLSFRNNNSGFTLCFISCPYFRKNYHKVTISLAEDGVNNLNCKKAGEIVGQDTGDLYEHLENLKNSKVTIYV